MPLQALDIKNLDTKYPEMNEYSTNVVLMAAKVTYHNAAWGSSGLKDNIDTFVSKRIHSDDQEKTGFAKLLAVLTYPHKNSNYQSYKFQIAKEMFGDDAINTALEGENNNTTAETIVQTLTFWVKIKIALQAEADEGTSINPGTSTRPARSKDIQLAEILCDAIEADNNLAITFLLAHGANPAYINDPALRQYACAVLLEQKAIKTVLTLIRDLDDDPVLISRWLDAAIAADRYDIVLLLVSTNPDLAAQAGFEYAPPDENTTPEPDPNAAGPSISTANPAPAAQWLDVSPLETLDADSLEAIFTSALEYWSTHWATSKMQARKPADIANGNCFQKLYEFYTTSEGSTKVNSLKFSIMRAALGDEPVMALLNRIDKNGKNKFAEKLVTAFTAWLKVKAMREKNDTHYFRGAIDQDVIPVVDTDQDSIYKDINNAIYTRNDQAAYLLYQEGAHPDKPYIVRDHAHTWLDEAISLSLYSLIEKVLSDADYQPKEHITIAIHKAMQRSNVRLIDQLLDIAERHDFLSKKIVVLTDYFFQYTRKKNPSLRMLSLILERIKELDPEDSFLHTSLNQRLTNNIRSINHAYVTLLLYHGANPFWTDAIGDTACNLAAGSRDALLEALLATTTHTPTASIGEAILIAAAGNQPERVLALVKKAKDVDLLRTHPTLLNLSNSPTFTALRAATFLGWPDDTIERLQNNATFTVMDYAMHFEWSNETIVYLTQEGAKPTIRNEEINTRLREIAQQSNLIYLNRPTSSLPPKPPTLSDNGAALLVGREDASSNEATGSAGLDPTLVEPTPERFTAMFEKQKNVYTRIDSEGNRYITNADL